MDLRIIDFPEYPWKTLNVHKDFNYSYNISPGKKIEGGFVRFLQDESCVLQ